MTKANNFVSICKSQQKKNSLKINKMYKLWLDTWNEVKLFETFFPFERIRTPPSFHFITTALVVYYLCNEYCKHDIELISVWAWCSFSLDMYVTVTHTHWIFKFIRVFPIEIFINVGAKNNSNVAKLKTCVIGHGLKMLNLRLKDMLGVF